MWHVVVIASVLVVIDERRSGQGGLPFQPQIHQRNTKAALIDKQIIQYPGVGAVLIGPTETEFEVDDGAMAADGYKRKGGVDDHRRRRADPPQVQPVGDARRLAT